MDERSLAKWREAYAMRRAIWSWSVGGVQAGVEPCGSSVLSWFGSLPGLALLASLVLSFDVALALAMSLLPPGPGIGSSGLLVYFGFDDAGKHMLDDRVVCPGGSKEHRDQSAGNGSDSGPDLEVHGQNGPSLDNVTLTPAVGRADSGG